MLLIRFSHMETLATKGVLTDAVYTSPRDHILHGYFFSPEN